MATLALLDDAVVQLRELIGPESSSGISDSFLKDASWNNYFDIGRSMEEIMGALHISLHHKWRSSYPNPEEKERRQQAAERKGEPWSSHFYLNPSVISGPFLSLLFHPFFHTFPCWSCCELHHCG